MKKTIVFLAIALAAFWNLQASSKDENKFNLAFAPKSETTYLLDLNTDHKIIQSLDGEKQALTQEMLLSWKYEILSKDENDIFQIGLTLSRVKLRQESGFQKSEYDSDNPPKYLDPPTKGLANLIGSELILKIASNGEILELIGIDIMTEKMTASMNLASSPALENLIDQFSQEAMRKSMQVLISFYPPYPVAAGDKWEKISDQTMGFPVRAVSVYSLQKVQGDSVIIDVISNLSSPDDSNPVKLGLINADYKMTGISNGTIWVDKTTGLPIKQKLSTQAEGTVSVSGVGHKTSINWPISVKIDFSAALEKQ